MNVEPDPPTILAELKAEIKAELKASEALRQSVSTEELDNAIVLATDYLRTGSETGIGRRLQQFVWSLWNNSHWINLYDLSSYTDRKCTEAMIIMFRAAMVRVLTEDHLRKILTDSGEIRSMGGLPCEHSGWRSRSLPTSAYVGQDFDQSCSFRPKIGKARRGRTHSLNHEA